MERAFRPGAYLASAHLCSNVWRRRFGCMILFTLRFRQWLAIARLDAASWIVCSLVVSEEMHEGIISGSLLALTIVMALNRLSRRNTSRAWLEWCRFRVMHVISRNPEARTLSITSTTRSSAAWCRTAEVAEELIHGQCGKLPQASLH